MPTTATDDDFARTFLVDTVPPRIRRRSAPRPTRTPTGRSRPRSPRSGAARSTSLGLAGYSVVIDGNPSVRSTTSLEAGDTAGAGHSRPTLAKAPGTSTSAPATTPATAPRAWRRTASGGSTPRRRPRRERSRARATIRQGHRSPMTRSTSPGAKRPTPSLASRATATPSTAIRPAAARAARRRACRRRAARSPTAVTMSTSARSISPATAARRFTADPTSSTPPARPACVVTSPSHIRLRPGRMTAASTSASAARRDAQRRRRLRRGLRPGERHRTDLHDHAGGHYLYRQQFV